MKNRVIAITGIVAGILSMAAFWIFTYKDLLEIIFCSFVIGFFAAGIAGLIFENEGGANMDRQNILGYAKELKSEGFDQSTCVARLAGFVQGAATVRPEATLTLADVKDILDTLSDTGTKKKPQRHSW